LPGTAKCASFLANSAGEPRCSLRPLIDTDLLIFEREYASRSGAGQYQWFGFGTPGRGLAEMGAIGYSGGRLTVVVEQRVIGSAFWFRREWGPPETSWCWELALHIHRAERGNGHGTEATKQLVRYLFVHTLAWRLQAIADVSNVPSQRVLERAGFLREGTLRSAQWREGERHDQHIYSRLRDDAEPVG
jgi:RimJ/RimL family protein N-acetyltransferase